MKDWHQVCAVCEHVLFYILLSCNILFVLVLSQIVGLTLHCYLGFSVNHESNLCRCFLSDETRPIARIIESILQCALDFRSCLTGEMWDAGTSQGNLMARLSGINMSQVMLTSLTL